ncbi:hypothetical protein GCM10020219_042440 [Nonomuraea dietziae]
MPLVFAAAGDVGDTPGEGIAGVATITYLSGLIAPAVTGWAAGALSYPAAFAMITAIVAVMTLLAGALRPPVAGRRRGGEAARAGGRVSGRQATPRSWRSATTAAPAPIR